VAAGRQYQKRDVDGSGMRLLIKLIDPRRTLLPARASVTEPG
jgi:hypothetical protein